MKEREYFFYKGVAATLLMKGVFFLQRCRSYAANVEEVIFFLQRCRSYAADEGGGMVFLLT
jgi:hypothetical protein